MTQRMIIGICNKALINSNIDEYLRFSIIYDLLAVKKLGLDVDDRIMKYEKVCLLMKRIDVYIEELDTFTFVQL